MFLGESPVAACCLGQSLQRLRLLDGAQGGGELIEPARRERIEHTRLAAETVVDAHRCNTCLGRHLPDGQGVDALTLEKPFRPFQEGRLDFEAGGAARRLRSHGLHYSMMYYN